MIENRSRPAAALAFALCFSGRKRVHGADEFMAELAAKRLVELLERAGFAVMKKLAICGAASLDCAATEWLFKPAVGR
jgi:hypothetical protein